MSNLLTPQEALQAIMNGKDVEVKFGEHYEWGNVLPNRMLLEELIDPEHQFRLSQEMITIGDVSFPKPESKAPEIGVRYFMTYLSARTFFAHHYWDGGEIDQGFLKAGLVHLSRENAIAHAKALIKLSRGECE